MISQHYMMSFCITFDMKSRVAYSVMGIISSVVGLVFGLRQCYIWHPHIQQGNERNKPSSNPIIVFSLSLANILAAFGSILLCVSTLLSPLHLWSNAISVNNVWIIIAQVLCNTGYMLSMIFTFWYIVDVCIQVYKRTSHDHVNLVSCWVAGIMLVMFVQFIRYFLAKKQLCTDIKGRTQILASFWLALLLLFFLTDFIILYFLDKKVKHDIYVLSNTYSAPQHTIVSRIRLKFLFIYLIFVICWLPTLMSCCFYLIDEKHSWLTFIWFPEILLNPLQSLFNFFIFTPQVIPTRNVEDETTQHFSSNYLDNNSFTSSFNQSLVVPFYPSVSVQNLSPTHSFFHFCPNNVNSRKRTSLSFMSRDSFTSSIVTYGSTWSHDDGRNIMFS